MGLLRRWLAEPLLHFFLLGGLLFGAYGLLQGREQPATEEIVITPGLLDSLRGQFLRSQQRPPSPEELQGLLDSWVREEIFYREGLAMGLERDDPVVRRRVGQKFEFLLEDSAPAAPTEAELQAWLDHHAEDYRIEARYTLQQRYFDPARHGDRLDAEMSAARQALERGEEVSGDATQLPAALEGRAAEVAQVFGPQFEQGLQHLPLAGWQGPLRSGFGQHLVRLSARDPGRVASLAEVRAEVERDVLRARSEAVAAERFKALQARYAVRVEALEAAR